MESLFVLGYYGIVVEIEHALVASIISMRIFGNGVSQLESLSTQLIFSLVVWLLCVYSWLSLV